MESTAGTSLQRNTSHHESKRLKREIDNDPHSKHRKKRAPQSISSTLHQAKVCDHFLPSAADRTCANCIPRATQSILRKVAISGYLSIQDLGRFLLCTSKNIVHDVYSNGDIAYQLLDRQVGYRRNSSPHDTPSMLCPLRLLHCLSKEEATRPDIPLRPLEFTPADYHVIINIFSMNQASGGKAIATKSIAGSSIPTFFDDGTFTEKIESFEIDIGIDYEISMHLLRSDGKCCCLIDCEAENWFGVSSIHHRYYIFHTIESFGLWSIDYC